MIAALVLAAVTSITPPVGPAGGGTVVVIRGNDLSTQINCLLPCPPRVVFGDAAAVDAVEKSDNELTVVTPAHAPGTVDVTVQIPGRDDVVVRAGFTFYTDAQAGYEEILLPIFIDGIVPGAYGTQWQSDFRLRNQGGPATIAHYQCPPNVSCLPVFPLTYTLLPGQSLPKSAKFAGTRSNPSLMLYVKEPSNVAMSLRVSDISRGTLNAGTDVPVIRESELLSAPAQLFNVPLNNGDRFRVLLRVYDTVVTKSDFSVRIYPDDDNSEPIYLATLTATTPQGGTFRTEAAYAELDFTELLRLGIAWPSSARIEVRPLTEGSRYWTFLSLTNNETQLVTLVTPQ